jgi:hypothetical protein
MGSHFRGKIYVLVLTKIGLSYDLADFFRKCIWSPLDLKFNPGGVMCVVVIVSAFATEGRVFESPPGCLLGVRNL